MRTCLGCTSSGQALMSILNYHVAKSPHSPGTTMQLSEAHSTTELIAHRGRPAMRSHCVFSNMQPSTTKVAVQIFQDLGFYLKSWKRLHKRDTLQFSKNSDLVLLFSPSFWFFALLLIKTRTVVC